jgi:hypothetical protein
MGAWQFTHGSGGSLEDFIAYWQGQEGGQERANYQLFLIGLTEALGLPRPDAAGPATERNHYVFERAVTFREADGATSTGRIDLYRHGCFVLEAKQSRLKGQKKAIPGQSHLCVPESEPRGERSASRAWDVLMLNARRQAEDYARALPVADGWPPFILVVDVGHCIEVFADFSGQGKNYAQFPDRQSYRIYLEDLRKPEVADRLRLVWTDPHKLDPAKQSAKVTREIAERLAGVSKSLEARKYQAEEVALFLMRCLFTMFAEDVELLPKACFKDLLAKCAKDESKFPHMVEQLWRAMDKGEFAFALEQKVLRFNGKLFKEAKALSLKHEDISELVEAAKADWRQVEPAIFGTLLEQALDVKERASLGAHYTPRAFVERLVVATIIEPLREDWLIAQATAERYRQEADNLHDEIEARHARIKTKDQKELDAIRDGRADVKKLRQQVLDTILGYHKKLCSTRVLDPACGTGNFLYVAMELMKRLEGEVLEALVSLGGQEALALDKDTVDPHQFLGIEKNTRAAPIAELVIWLGYLQWHFRTRGGIPSEPILRDFKNIECRDAVLDWDGAPLPQTMRLEGKTVETYPNPRRPEWPEAEFIVGNPPFIGVRQIRGRLPDEYVDALRAAYPDVPETSDFVMYWWHISASKVARLSARRFGLVATNSIAQVYSRPLIRQHLKEAKKRVWLSWVISDHPWTDEQTGAHVRVCMCVGEPQNTKGARNARYGIVTREDGPNSEVTFTDVHAISESLQIDLGVDDAVPLLANEGMCFQGVVPAGEGFKLNQDEAETLRSLGADYARLIKRYAIGRDIVQIPESRFIIDAFGCDERELRTQAPYLYQRLLELVKPERDKNRRAQYRDNWWVFAEPRPAMRSALQGLRQFIGIPYTSKHRLFGFVDSSVLPDAMLYAAASDDPLIFGVLCSRVHIVWSLRTGGTLEDRPRYNKSRCFDPFPFPTPSASVATEIRAIAEELDTHRKARQADHPTLTLTEMYNVLEKLSAGVPLDDNDKRIKDDGLVLMLKEYHDRLDAAVALAYGWPLDLSDEQILERLVALNAERAAEEKAGKVRWLRPEYQIPRFGSDAEKARWNEEQRPKTEPTYVPPAETGIRPAQSVLGLQGDLSEMIPRDDDPTKPRFPTNNEMAETAAVMSAFLSSSKPLSPTEVARHFKGGRQNERRVKLVIDALARLGHISSTDGGESFALRRSRA